MKEEQFKLTKERQWPRQAGGNQFALQKAVELNSEALKRLLASSGQSGIETQHTRMQSQHVDLPSCIQRWGKNQFYCEGINPLRQITE